MKMWMMGLVGVLGFGALAYAAPDSSAAFRDAMTKKAAEDQRWIESWWDADLDGDKKLERVAVLCDTSGDEKHGWLVIEKDASHAWEIEFDVDGKTRACKTKPAEPPKWESRTDGLVTLRQDHNDGYTVTSYAIRVGQPVVVREEEQSSTENEGKPVVKDWDALVKKKKEKNYQLPEHLRKL